MIAVVNTFVLCYAALFPIVNPVGSAPLFLGLTQFATEKMRNALAVRVAISSFFMLLGSLFIGSHVLEFFGISLPVVRIGGGLVVTSFGWKLLNSDARLDGNHARDDSSATVPGAFYPLTMPLTVGPGSTYVAITLGTQRQSSAAFSALAQFGCGAMAGLLAIGASVYLCYRFAESTVAALGKSGTNVLVRLSASSCSASESRFFGAAGKTWGPLSTSRLGPGLFRDRSGACSALPCLWRAWFGAAGPLYHSLPTGITSHGF